MNLHWMDIKEISDDLNGVIIYPEILTLDSLQYGHQGIALRSVPGNQCLKFTAQAFLLGHQIHAAPP
jgi:hypothetical protein